MADWPAARHENTHPTHPTHPPTHPTWQNLTGTVPDLSGAAELQAVRLQGNRLGGALPALPPAVREVNLEYNQLT